jgi:hypothetical protein
MKTFKNRWIHIVFFTIVILAVWVYVVPVIRYRNEPKPTMQWMGNSRHLHPPGPAEKTQFEPGKVKLSGDKYSKRLIVPQSGEEDVDWITDNFGAMREERWDGWCMIREI